MYQPHILVPSRLHLPEGGYHLCSLRPSLCKGATGCGNTHLWMGNLMAGLQNESNLLSSIDGLFAHLRCLLIHLAFLSIFLRVHWLKLIWNECVDLHMDIGCIEITMLIRTWVPGAVKILGRLALPLQDPCLSIFLNWTEWIGEHQVFPGLKTQETCHTMICCLLDSKHVITLCHM